MAKCYFNVVTPVSHNGTVVYLLKFSLNQFSIDSWQCHSIGLFADRTKGELVVHYQLDPQIQYSSGQSIKASMGGQSLDVTIQRVSNYHPRIRN